MNKDMVTPQSEKLPLFPYTRKALSAVKWEWRFLLNTLRSAVSYSVDVVHYIASGQFSFRHFIQQLSFVGIDTLGISLVMTTFAGMVIALQIAKEMVKQGAGDYVGALVSMALIRELAPIMTAFAVIAMAGSAYAAELSTMKITNQVSALEVLHVSPVRYLVMPRVLAGIVALPMMTVITSFAGIIGGMIISHLLAGVSFGQYLDSVWSQTELKDIWAMLLKAGVFGFIVFMMSTTIGINTRGGSKEVGLATTRAVVWSFVLMAILDYVLTFLVYGARS